MPRGSVLFPPAKRAARLEGMTSKALLRRALAERIPAEVLARGEPTGRACPSLTRLRRATAGPGCRVVAPALAAALTLAPATTPVAVAIARGPAAASAASRAPVGVADPAAPAQAPGDSGSLADPPAEAPVDSAVPRAAPPSAGRAPSPPPAPPAPADTARPVIFLREIVVTGARYPRAYYESPQALSFVSRAQLGEQPAAVLGDVLGALPGVDMSKDSPWEQRPIVRGLGGQRVLVLMDGSPVNSARGNGPHPSLVDPSQVERIEVVRGPASVAYGSDALGGAINIITRDPLLPEGDRFRARATLGGSSVDKQRHGHAEIVPRLGPVTLLLAGGGRRALDYGLPGIATMAGSAFKDHHGLADLRWAATRHLLLRGSFQLYRGRDIGLPGLTASFPGFRQEFSFPQYDRDAAHLALEHAYPAGWLARTRVKLYWQRERRNFFSHEELATFLLPPGTPVPTGARTRVSDQDRFLDLDTWGFQTQLTTRRTPRYRLGAGIDLARDRTGGDNVRRRRWVDAYGTTVQTDPDRVNASVPDGTFASYAGFVQGEWFPASRWTVTAGGRYTRYRYRTARGLAAPAAGGSPAQYFEPRSVDDGAFSGGLGAVFAPVAELHLTAHVANGYRQPNAQDLFFNGPASIGTVLGNPDLKPERSVSYDVGLRWGPGSLGVAGNLFYATYDDLIEAVQVAPPPAPGAPATYQYVNLTRARIWGGDLEAEWRLPRGFQARLAMAGQIGDITSAEAIRRLYGVVQEQAPLPGIPPFKGAAAVRWRHPGGRFWVEPAARWSWRTNRLPLPTPGVPFFTEFKKEWLVGDVMAGMRLPRGQRVEAGVRNVADRSYRQANGSLEEPGRSWVGSLTVDF